MPEDRQPSSCAVGQRLQQPQLGARGHDRDGVEHLAGLGCRAARRARARRRGRCRGRPRRPRAPRSRRTGCPRCARAAHRRRPRARPRGSRPRPARAAPASAVRERGSSPSTIRSGCVASELVVAIGGEHERAGASRSGAPAAGRRRAWPRRPSAGPRARRSSARGGAAPPRAPRAPRRRRGRRPRPARPPHVHERPQRPRRVQRVAGAGQHAGVGPRAERAHERGLADPGLARDQHQRPAAGGRHAVERARQLSELIGTLKKQLATVCRHRLPIVSDGGESGAVKCRPRRSPTVTGWWWTA